MNRFVKPNLDVYINQITSKSDCAAVKDIRSQKTKMTQLNQAPS